MWTGISTAEFPGLCADNCKIMNTYCLYNKNTNIDCFHTFTWNLGEHSLKSANEINCLLLQSASLAFRQLAPWCKLENDVISFFLLILRHIRSPLFVFSAYGQMKLVNAGADNRSKSCDKRSQTLPFCWQASFFRPLF